MEGALDKVLKYLEDIRAAYLKSCEGDPDLRGIIRITDITRLDECIAEITVCTEDYLESDWVKDIPELR